MSDRYPESLRLLLHAYAMSTSGPPNFVKRTSGHNRTNIATDETVEEPIDKYHPFLPCRPPKRVIGIRERRLRDQQNMAIAFLCVLQGMNVLIIVLVDESFCAWSYAVGCLDLWRHGRCCIFLHLGCEWNGDVPERV